MLKCIYLCGIFLIMKFKDFVFTAVFLISILFPSIYLAAAPAEQEINDYLEQLDESERNVFNSRDLVFRYDEELTGPVYLPDSEFADQILNMHNSLQPEVMVEALYFIDYPADFSRDTDVIKKRLNETVHSLSSINGTMYYSRTEKDYAVLFKDVYAVEGPDSRKKTADPAAPDFIPAVESVYLHMKEHSMGRGYYRMDYLSSGNELAISLTNSSAMSKIIKAVEKNDMKIFLQMIPCREGLLVYGYCGVVLQNDGLINLMMDPYYSFYRRMTAMETWLYNSLHGSDKRPALDEPMP